MFSWWIVVVDTAAGPMPIGPMYIPEASGRGLVDSLCAERTHQIARSRVYRWDGSQWRLKAACNLEG